MARISKWSLVLGSAAAIAAFGGPTPDVRAAELLSLRVLSVNGDIVMLEAVADMDQVGYAEVQVGPAPYTGPIVHRLSLQPGQNIFMVPTPPGPGWITVDGPMFDPTTTEKGANDDEPGFNG